jgi:hypothetical protein
MKKQNKDFAQQLQQRNPEALKREERIIVRPIDMLVPQEEKEESTQVDKTTNILVDNPTSGEVHNPAKTQKKGKPTSIQTDKTTTPQVGKYTTHLRPDTIKAIKRYAVEHDIKDYEVVQKALDRFFK